MLATDSRSQRGCWTCRARRKKCDERAQPTCYTCESLQLDCHGYGPRPDWMDAGNREKARVLEFKNAVKRSSKMRKRSRTLSGTDGTLRNMLQPSPILDQSYSMTGTPSYVRELNCGSSMGAITIASHPPYTMLSAMPLDNTFGGVEMDFSEEIIPQGLVKPDLMDSMDSSYLNSIFWAIDRTQAIKEPYGILEEHPKGGVEYQLGYISSSSPVSNGSTPTSTSSRGSSGMIPPRASSVVFNERLRNLSVGELSAIRFYFEDIVPAQFQFLDASTMQDFCGQLLELAGSSKICLSAVINQGMHGQQSELSSLALDSSSSFKVSANCDHTRSLESLHRSIKDWDWVQKDSTDPCVEFRIIETIVCTALTILSMINQGDDGWTQIMQTVASFQPIDFDRLKNQNLRSLWGFQTMLVCIDILACVTTSSEPTFALKFQDYFKEDDRLRCGEVIGCDTSVMESIMDIAKLQSWKAQETATESISVIELAKRALKIDLCLQQTRQKNMERIKNHSVLISSVKEPWIITNIFACAASIYLHAAVSGCCPEVPEIKIGVADTIDAMKLLPRINLVKRVMWPVCISACLADGAQREFFDQLEFGLKEVLGTSQNILRALQTGKECRELRRSITTPRRIYSWLDAMDSLDDFVPLIF